MNRSTDNSQGGDLPGFLNTDSAEHEETVEEHDTEEDGAAEVFDEDVEDGEFPFDEEADEDEVDTPEIAAPTRPSRSRGSRQRQTVTRAGGGLAMTVGLLLTVSAFVLTIVPSLANTMIGFAIEPQIILLMGIAVFAIGAGQRRVGNMQRRLDELEGDRQERDDELRNTLEELLANQQNGQPALGEGNELQHVLLSLQRQDEKINNLTKAIKMYGKPLMEIAGQGTEISGGVSQLRSVIEETGEATQKACGRIEKALGESSTPELDGLGDQLGKLEVSLAAITQRLEDTEVRKSLVRLEDTSKKLQEELTDLQRGESVHKATQSLQERLDQATQGLTDGINQMRDGNLGALEGTVRDIQREVSGLATGLAQIQAAVKNGRPVAAAAPAPAAAPAAAAAPSSAPATSAAPAASDDKQADKGDGYATGKRQTAGKNVLGAIAKLKKMKG